MNKKRDTARGSLKSHYNQKYTQKNNKETKKQLQRGKMTKAFPGQSLHSPGSSPGRTWNCSLARPPGGHRHQTPKNQLNRFLSMQMSSSSTTSSLQRRRYPSLIPVGKLLGAMWLPTRLLHSTAAPLPAARWYDQEKPSNIYIHIYIGLVTEFIGPSRSEDDASSVSHQTPDRL